MTFTTFLLTLFIVIIPSALMGYMMGNTHILVFSEFENTPLLYCLIILAISGGIGLLYRDICELMRKSQNIDYWCFSLWIGFIVFAMGYISITVSHMFPSASILNPIVMASLAPLLSIIF